MNPTISQRLSDFFKTAVGTNTGLCGVLWALSPYLNPVLASHGFPTFTTTAVAATAPPLLPATSASTTMGGLGYALLGATLIAVRAAIAKAFAAPRITLDPPAK